MSRTFAELGVPAALTAVLSAQGIAEPFPIQAATLPDALQGLDVSGRAPTGSGKTLAFGLAAVTRLLGGAERVRGGRKGRTAPSALILVPTRELAAQVERTIAPLLAAVGGRALSIYGGVGYGGQRAALRRGVEVVVGCPGRLEDLVQTGDLVLDHVSIAVVDEADRMSDMGFLPAVRRLLDRTREDRQTLLFSATLDGEVDVLVRNYQREPRRHEVETPADQIGQVRHAFWRTDQAERVDLLTELVRVHAPAVVFCRTRHGADRLATRLGAAGVTAAPIHGSRSQPQRDKALAAFAAGKVRALVATDVAARGIHVDDVSCVIHFDLPADSKDYVHRSGRTGRAGADGLVVSFVGPDQTKAVQAMQRSLGLPVGVERADVAALPSLAPSNVGLVAGSSAAPVTLSAGRGGAPARSGPRRAGGHQGDHSRPGQSPAGRSARGRSGERQHPSGAPGAPRAARRRQGR